MRYILDDNNYIEAVSCTPFNCKDKSCKEYTGAVPANYNSIEEWATTANIRAYYLVDGNLTLDAARAAELEAEWEIEAINKELYYVKGEKYAFEAPDTYNAVWTGGTLTTGRKQIVFTIWLPKRIDKINTITLNGIILSARSNLGSYLLGKTTDKSKITVSKATENSITLVHLTDTAYATTDATNNTPVAICLEKLDITFN